MNGELTIHKVCGLQRFTHFIFQHPLVDFPPCCPKGGTEGERGSVPCPKSNSVERRDQEAEPGRADPRLSLCAALPGGGGAPGVPGSHPKSVPLLVTCILRALQRSRPCGGG